jgi:preprotein translocase subunit SecF
MTREELEDARIEAEIAKFNAETQKLTSETEIGRRTGWDRFADSLKLFAAIFGTLVASVAAVTTYRVIQLETKFAEKERAEVKADKERIERETIRLAGEKKNLELDKNALETEKKRLESERDKTAREVAAKSAERQKADAALATANQRLRDVRAQLGRITRATPATVVESSIQEAKTALTRQPEPVPEKHSFILFLPQRIRPLQRRT